MTEAYWFDLVNKAVAQATTRREVTRSISMLIPGLPLGGLASALAGQKKHGKKNKPKNKKKKPGKRCAPEPQSCSGGACDTEPEWFGNQCAINYCEFVCRQCDEDDPRQFCIRDGTKRDGTPTKVAVCCRAGETCCGFDCADTKISGKHCGTCFNPCRSRELCIDGDCRCPANLEPCPTDARGCCSPGEFCDVFGCELGACSDTVSCPTGENCCPGPGGFRCVDLTSHPGHCGRCENVCDQSNGGHWCVGGRCHPCPAGEKLCGPHPLNSEMYCVFDNYDCCATGGACPPDAHCCTSSTGAPYCSIHSSCPGY